MAVHFLHKSSSASGTLLPSLKIHFLGDLSIAPLPSHHHILLGALLMGGPPVYIYTCRKLYDCIGQISRLHMFDRRYRNIGRYYIMVLVCLSM